MMNQPLFLNMKVVVEFLNIINGSDRDFGAYEIKNNKKRVSSKTSGGTL